MARRAALFHIRPRDGFAHIDCYIGTARVRESLGVPYAKHPSREQARAAQEAAEKRYGELIAGRSLSPKDRVLTTATLDELGAMWLDAIETPSNKPSVDVKGTYVRTWAAFASDAATLLSGEPRWKGDARTPLERLVSDAGPEDLVMERLRRVLRKTVRKEVSALVAFFRWAVTRKYLAAAPPRPVLPAGETGVRSGKQRAAPVDIDAVEARAIIDALPEWSTDSPRKGQPAFRVRDPHDFMWEQTWRQITIGRLSVPENWRPGANKVVLRDADDKARYGRTVKLSARAQAILERCAPKAGLIFGKHDYRAFIKAAALKVLPRAKALLFAAYDFRHGRINNLLETSGSLHGVAFVAGHKQLTTTNAYLRGQQRHGDAVMDAADAALAARAAETITDTDPSREGERDESGGDTSDVDPTAYQSGREDSNLRPLDPQRTPPAQAVEGIGEPGNSPNAETRSDALGREPIPSRIGHAAHAERFVTDARRALAFAEVIGDAFDDIIADDLGIERPRRGGPR